MNCFTEEQLRAFAIGRLDGDSAEAIGRHLEQCPTCEDTVAALDDATDSLLRELRQPVTVSSVHAADSAFQRAQQQVENDPFLPLQHSSTQSPDRQFAAGVPQQLRDYQLVEPLGQGGMGTVYRALHLRLNRQVAFKLLPERRLRDSLAVARFQREMQTIGKMDHPAIVRAMDAGEVAGQHYLAMELVDGVDLGRLARHCGPLSIGAACELIRQAAIGLEHVHTSGIVHRDIKPSNVMLDRQGHVKILDLGLALLDGVHGATDELTTVGQLMGTLDYMAPEQFQDSHDVDRRADIYGLSATLYKLLTGHAPYAGPQGRTPLQKLKALATEPVPPIRGRRSEIPEALAAAIHWGLDHAPERRPDTAAAWAAAIESWAEPHALQPLIREFDSIRREVVTALPGPADVPLATSLKAQSSGAERAEVAAQPALTAMSPLSSGDPPRRWRNKLLGLAAGAAAIFCGWILYVETDKGQLIIQSPADNVELQIAQEGQPSDTTTLRAGDNTLRLRSGDYTLSLSGDVRGLRLEEGHLHVTRGQQHTATIVADSTDHALAEGTKKPTTDAKTPRYSGKSFDEWLELLQTERDQTEQHRAMVALSHLADVRGGREVMRILLQHVEPGTWGDPAMYAAIKPVDREAGMREVLQAGTTEEHARALAVLGLPSYPPLPDSDQPLLVALTRDRELQSAARDALARIRRWDPSTVDRFAEWARDDDPDVAFYAAMLLAAHEQQPTFVTALLKYVQPAAISLRTPETRWRLAQAVKLIRLLSSAEIAPAATAKLAELLNSNDPDLFTPDPQSGLPSDPIFMSVLRQQDQSRQHLATKHRTLGSLVIASLEVLASHTEQATHVLAEFVGAPTAHPELLAMNGYRDTWEDGATAVERIYRSAHAETANANLMLDAVQQLRDRLRQFQEEGNGGAPAAVSTTSSAPSATNLPAATSLEPTVSVSNQPEPGPAPSEQTSGDHATADDSPAVAATHSYDNRTLDEWLGVALTSQPFGEEGVTYQGREHFDVSAVVTAIRTLARNESAEVRNRQFANWREICRQELSPARLGFNLRVLSALAVADLADQALADIFQSLERMSTDDLDMGVWFPIFAKHVNEALRILPQERVDARVEEGLLHGSSLTRTILLFDQRLDAATHLEGVLAASHDTNSNLAGMALERLRRIAPIAPAAKQRLETALEDPALQHIAARELFQLETRQGTFEQAAKMAESREPRQALLGLAGLLWLERQPATEQTVEDGIATAEDGITWLLEQDDWGLADAQRPMLDPRAFAILGLARNIDPELAARLLEKRFPDRTDIRDRLLKQSSLGGR